MIIIKYYEWVRFQPDQRQPVYELCKRYSSQKEGVTSLSLKSDLRRRKTGTHVFSTLRGTVSPQVQVLFE